MNRIVAVRIDRVQPEFIAVDLYREEPCCKQPSLMDLVLGLCRDPDYAARVCRYPDGGMKGYRVVMTGTVYRSAAGAPP